ncbi:GNAT family N-acetyltransferase [Paenibacillus sp. DMB20]|uniref:GNAT family N-acetyltransferase n=1 Tax=Paenibacillus sp. DMB20 TaxID=1642570 RepID=UPI000627D5C1|nr:GNAT family N-acetyltransferase [Paenibacillus sp. DMB20]KKO54767.1 hypothetical protein XI25_04570 [Paenibacillus sp. DMB20]KKO55027.1 hypothetical protein XI25_03625 [Paenibacillus sp. DMB20]
MRHNYTIQSGDILLTPICEDDIEIMRGWRNSPLNNASFLMNSYIDAEQQKLWYRRYLEKSDDIMFIINDLTGNKTRIGMVGLYDINNEEGTAEFGRLLIGERSARGRGLGFVITSMLCDFAFNQLELKEIKLEVLSENNKAYGIYRKVGFESVRHYSREGKEVIKMLLVKENLICV